MYRTIEREFRENGEEVLAQAVSILHTHRARISTTRDGWTGKENLRTAEQNNIGLIVLGARGLGPVRELIFGSVSPR